MPAVRSSQPRRGSATSAAPRSPLRTLLGGVPGFPGPWRGRRLVHWSLWLRCEDQQQGNTVQERRAYADFLRNEPGEMAKQRPEYAQDAHLDALTSFKAEATRVIGTRPAS